MGFMCSMLGVEVTGIFVCLKDYIWDSQDPAEGGYCKNSHSEPSRYETMHLNSCLTGAACDMSRPKMEDC